MKIWFVKLGRKSIEMAMLFSLGVVLLGVGVYFNNFNDKALTVATAIPEPVYQGSEQYKSMALTVNVAWGEDYLPQMLETLQEKKVKATFFVEGRFAEKYPELIKQISEQGHEIGSHGYSHPHADDISKEENITEISKAEKVLEEITGVKPVLFAPPYGEREDHVLSAAAESGYTTTLWSIDTIDWQLPDASVIVERVTEKAHNGGIVLMHPTAPTVSALPLMIDQLQDQGYELMTISQLLNQDGKDGGNNSNSSDSQTDSSDAQPDSSDSQSDSSDAQTDSSDAQTDSSDSQTDSSDAQPDSTSPTDGGNSQIDNNDAKLDGAS